MQMGVLSSRADWCFGRCSRLVSGYLHVDSNSSAAGPLHKLTIRLPSVPFFRHLQVGPGRSPGIGTVFG